jgi:hypothetical protein
MMLGVGLMAWFCLLLHCTADLSRTCTELGKGTLDCSWFAFRTNELEVLESQAEYKLSNN